MFLLATAVLLMGAVYTEAAKDLCCPPPIWQARMFDLKAPTGLQYVTQYATNRTSKMTASATVDRVTGKLLFQQVEDYNTMTYYRMDTYSAMANQCQTGKITTPWYNACDTSTWTVKYVGNATLGGPTNGFMYDAYEIMAGGQNMTLSLTQDCIPVLENIVTANGEESLLLFNDVTTNVDMNMFDKPKVCNPVVG